MRDTISNLEMLRNAAQAVNAVLHEPEIIEALLDQAVAALAARAALLRLLSPDGDELLPAGARGLSDTYLAKGPRFSSRCDLDRLPSSCLAYL